MKAEKKIGKALMCAGGLCLAGAIFLSGYNFYDQSRAEREVNESVSVIEELTPETPIDSEFDEPFYELAPDMEMPVITHEGVDYIGTLYVESLDLKLPVISEWSYPSLKKAPCRYTGSAYKDSLVIAAHNYQSHFGKLRNIEIGASIVFVDAEANRFEYRVVATEELFPSNVEDMISGEYDLSLFTCTIGGRTRFTVRCEKV